MLHFHECFYHLLTLAVLCVRTGPVAFQDPEQPQQVNRINTPSCTFPSLLCNQSSSLRCLRASEICDGIPQCDNSQDEAGCGGEMNDFIASHALTLSPTVEPHQVIEDVSIHSCAKLCREEDRYVCTGFQHHAESNRCLLLEANSGPTSASPSLWTHFQRTAQVIRIPDDGNSVSKPTLPPMTQVESDPTVAKFDTLPPERRKRQLLSVHSARTFIGNLSPTLVSSSRSSALDINGRSRSQQGACGKRSVEFEPPHPPSTRFSRIVGGVDAPLGAFPWQVAIKRKDETQPWCGGAIIDSRFVLTAAHCIDHFHRKGREFVVVAGEHDLGTNNTKEQVFEVENFVTYPNYRSSKTGNDIALVKLQTIDGQGIVFTEVAQPICLPTSEEVYKPGTPCSVSGWGMQIANDKKSVPNVLQVASVPLLSGATCIDKEVYGNFLSSNNFPDSMVCAGYLEGKTDACSGDSGGPLACRVDGQFQLLGLVSWGDVQPGGCASANKPGVYTKTLRYIDWIEEWMKKL